MSGDAGGRGTCDGHPGSGGLTATRGERGDGKRTVKMRRYHQPPATELLGVVGAWVGCATVTLADEAGGQRPHARERAGEARDGLLSVTTRCSVIRVTCEKMHRPAITKSNDAPKKATPTTRKATFCTT